MPGRSTAEEYVSPGPSHYSPRDTITAHATPKYSMIGRDSCAIPNTLPYPSPADRDISTDLLRVQTRYISQKGKGTTWPYGTRKDNHITTSPGPNLNLVYKNLGSSEGGACLSDRNKHGIIQGYPSKFAQPVDTLGFQTPGPAEYTPHPTDTIPGVKKSFGVVLPRESAYTCTPGAGSYEIVGSFDDTTAGHNFGRRIEGYTMDIKPSPNKYYLPSTNNKNLSFTMQSKNEPVFKSNGVSPNSYHISATNSTGGKYSRSTGMQYRAFDANPTIAPTATSYDVDKPFHADTSPLHASRCLPVYPDVLQYPEFRSLSTPSPSLYHPSLSLTRPLDPSYTFGTAFRRSSSLTPAPNRYNTQDIKTSKHLHGSSYTMRPRTVDLSADSVKHQLPGPSDYCTYEVKTSTPLYSFGRKHSHEDKLDMSNTPADLSPSTYQIPDNISHRGVIKSPAYSIKGKISPKMYNGFSNSSILVKLSSVS
ncbi:hypothetical protein LOD99_11843 [Oopsacas minuta]|uniref:Outer dense fiber protein 3 n=1 Tax=Oopsacas minuta TaxID=111878 RepID=A0AAV7JLB5_9METZ|nr:hypothetical protein LOD99_11843 [Oopsacas minuta]